MRLTWVLVLLGAATNILATSSGDQLRDQVVVAVAVDHVEPQTEDSLCQVEATSDLTCQTSHAIPEAESHMTASWTDVATTVIVAGAWTHNTTNTPPTPLPTEDSGKTDSKPAEVTGGALPQPMKASAAGLLGFFIMSLVML